MTFRDVLTWKTYFYNMLLPVLRRLGPAAGDAILGALGRFVAFAWPQRRRELNGALRRLGTDPGDDRTRRALRKRLEGTYYATSPATACWTGRATPTSSRGSTSAGPSTLTRRSVRGAG